MTAIPPLPRVRRREGRRRGRARRPRRSREADLPPGEVEIRVGWSSVNYKDGLATRADGKVARISPLIPGIDLAGEVVALGRSGDRRSGSAVLAHGYELGVSRHGGYTEYQRVPAGWVVPLAPGLTPRDAMSIGTAGFTAAMSVVALEDRGLSAGRRAGAGDRRVGRGRRHGPRDPGRPRLRGLGGDRQARRGGAAADAGRGRDPDPGRGDRRGHGRSNWNAGPGPSTRSARRRCRTCCGRCGSVAAVAVVRQCRRRQARDDGLPVHPARRRAARDGFGQHADRPAARAVGPPGDRPPSARPRRPLHGGHAGHARRGARRDRRRGPPAAAGSSGSAE